MHYIRQTANIANPPNIIPTKFYGIILGSDGGRVHYSNGETTSSGIHCWKWSEVWQARYMPCNVYKHEESQGKLATCLVMSTSMRNHKASSLHVL